MEDAGNQMRPTTAESAAMIDLITSGRAPHYALILDKSPRGLALLAEIKETPGELHARATSAATKMWESAPFHYVIIWGTWGMSGGMTLQAHDLHHLLDVAIPKAMQRNAEKGGMCTFFPLVANDVLPAVMKKVAQLQHTAGDPARPN